jgi:hypothetical protein
MTIACGGSACGAEFGAAISVLPLTGISILASRSIARIPPTASGWAVDARFFRPCAPQKARPPQFAARSHLHLCSTVEILPSFLQQVKPIATPPPSHDPWRRSAAGSPDAPVPHRSPRTAVFRAALARNGQRCRANREGNSRFLDRSVVLNCARVILSKILGMVPRRWRETALCKDERV